MKLGNRIRELREECGLTQGQLAGSATVSQGYLSQLENGDVKNPSAAVLLRVAQAIQVDPDDLFEAAGYPTVRTLRQVYQGYESNIDPDLLRYLGRLPRDRQRRLLLLLESMTTVVVQGEESEGDAAELAPDRDKEPGNGRRNRRQLPNASRGSRIKG
jgi:transcriptional regulator with XRE-family HTH domain